MKKFSKLNESVKIDQSKLESILSELEGVTYKVFDYFSITSKRYSTTRGDYESLSFVEDISRIKASSKNAKIILIKPKFEVELKGNDERILTTLASLCPHMTNKSSGYSWISSQPKDEELENIADIINQMGFIIEFISPQYSDDISKAKYTFKLVEI